MAIFTENYRKMELSASLKQFIREHFNDSTDRLLLTASRYPGIDIPFVVDQIESRRQIRNKLPSWYNQEELIYPSRLSAEQCSSEQTARYKQQLIKGDCICDLTGGLGVDSYYFAKKAPKIIYIERSAIHCEAARHNFKILNVPNIEIRQADACQLLSSLQADTFYLDPARRKEGNRRAFALNECEPDVLQLKPLLMEHSQRVLIKISPMADLEETLRLLPETKEIHILAVRNECKELLFLLENPVTASHAVKIFAVNLDERTDTRPFVFTPMEEKETALRVRENLGTYLYEPHAALLKSGAFKLIASRFGTFKLHKNSHLYTSDQLCADFPGRIFLIDQTYDFSGKNLKQLHREIPQANITTRNFPISVAELRKRSRIQEGGEIYLFATTLCSEQRVLIRTHKLP